jgi:hypothetical protein
MQTFLPLPDIRDSAECLDWQRLGKQRVEAKQIYNIVSEGRTTGGWVNHPAVRMWRNYPDALAFYHNVIIDEWVKRGYQNAMPHLHVPDGEIVMPWWFGDYDFHRAHRQILVRKLPEHYAKFQWSDITTGPWEYVWPASQPI